MFFWAVARVKRPAIVSLFGCGLLTGPFAALRVITARVSVTVGLVRLSDTAVADYRACLAKYRKSFLAPSVP